MASPDLTTVGVFFSKYNQYVMNGGRLDFNTWLNNGMPLSPMPQPTPVSYHQSASGSTLNWQPRQVTVAAPKTQLPAPVNTAGIATQSHVKATNPATPTPAPQAATGRTLQQAADLYLAGAPPSAFTKEEYDWLQGQIAAGIYPPLWGADKTDNTLDNQIKQSQLAYNQWQLSEAQRQLALQETPEAKAKREANAWNAAFAQAQTQMNPNWEGMRQQVVASLNQPSDWIKRWFAQNAPNPYPSATEQDLRDQMAVLQYVDIPKAQANEDALAGANYVLDPNTDQITPPPSGNLSKLVAQFETMQTMADNYQMQRERQPSGPPVAPWLARFTNLTPGSSLPANGQVVNPGAQDLATLDKNQWSALSGLADYWGQDINSINQQAEAMLPTGRVGNVARRPARAR